MLDTDKDGTLTMEELRTGLEKNGIFELLRRDYNGHEGTGIIDDEFELIMESLDVNNDGKLDYNEFLQATINAQSNLNETTIKEMFNMFAVSAAHIAVVSGKDIDEATQLILSNYEGAYIDRNLANDVVEASKKVREFLVGVLPEET